MTSRERLIAAMNCEKTDRAPVAPFVYGNTVREWTNDMSADLIEGTIAFCRHYGFDTILRNINIRHNDAGISSSEWRSSLHKHLSGVNTVTTTEIKTPGGLLSCQITSTPSGKYGSVDATREYYIKSSPDFDLFRRYVPKPEPSGLSELDRAALAIGDSGILAPWCNGVFSYMASLRGLQDLLVDPLTDPGFYNDLAEFCLSRLKSALAPVLEHGVNFLSYTGNIATASLVGAEYFERWVLPYEKKLIDWIQGQCRGIIYHNCGNGQGLIELYNQLELRCYESMTEPPYADNSLDVFLKKMRPETALMGNIDQIDFLRKATPAEVLAKALGVLKRAEHRPGFILGTSDFLEEGTPPENLLALAASVHEV